MDAIVPGAPNPTSNYADYRMCVAETVEQPPLEWRFKRDERYRRILEHVSHHQAEQFIALASTEFSDRWEAIRRIAQQTAVLNDSRGSPYVHDFAPLGIACSPSNLRYLWHALLVLRRLEGLSTLVHVDQNRDPVSRLPWSGHIIEVGGGYGGLALYMHCLAELFPSVQLQSYTMIDLPEVSALQGKMMAELGLPVRTVCGLYEADLARAILDTDGERFFVSAYAFSEFDQQTREWYQSKLVRHCQHGFIVWNFMYGVFDFEVMLGGPIYRFVEATIEVEPERPLVDPGMGNQFVWW